MADLSSLPFEPVYVVTRVGRQSNVTSVSEAAEFLIGDDWPKHGRGEAYMTAMQVCYSALVTTGDIEAARTAFVEAAKVAGIFVKEGDGRR